MGAGLLWSTAGAVLSLRAGGLRGLVWLAPLRTAASAAAAASLISRSAAGSPDFAVGRAPRLGAGCVGSAALASFSRVSLPGAPKLSGGSLVSVVVWVSVIVLAFSILRRGTFCPTGTSLSVLCTFRYSL